MYVHLGRVCTNRTANRKRDELGYTIMQATEILLRFQQFTFIINMCYNNLLNLNLE